MFEVREIMNTKLVTIQRTARVSEAIRLMVDHHITGLPVVDEDMNLKGIITEKDVLELLYREDEPEAYVGHLMSNNVRCFAPGDLITDVCECLIENPYRRVPICEDGRLVGIISRKDIIGFILYLHKEVTAC